MNKNKKSAGTSWGEVVRDTLYFLTILFTALRACDIINWNWFWIMSPVFFSWIIGIGALALAGLATIAILSKKDETDGTTFTPTVSSAGVISWTNDGNKQNPQSDEKG